MKIGVVGLGLIGGSIFKNLSEIYEVVGVSSSVDIENVSKDYEILKDCNLVFVCTPMSVTLDILEKLEDVLSSDVIVTDVCSLKEFLTHKKYKFKFLPSHPLAGTEHSGWGNSFPELFVNATWAITPVDKAMESEIEILKSVISNMGANTIITTPAEHDKAVALISHMPLVLAQALCENIKDNKLAQVLASSGFRDTTRLALSNTQMATDMVRLNRENIVNSLESLERAVKTILQSDYTQKSQEIKNFRQNLYS